MQTVNLKWLNIRTLGLLIPIVLLFLSSLPTSITFIQHLMFLTICGIIIFLNIFYLRSLAVTKLDLLYLSLIVMLTFSYYRILGAGIIEPSSLVLLILKVVFLSFAILFAFRNIPAETDSIIYYIYISLILYVAINFLLFLLGIQNRSESVNGGNLGNSSLLALLGISHDRVLFIFAQGFQSFGFIIGLVFIYNYFIKLNTVFLNKIVFAVTLMIMMLADVRGALLLSLVAILSVTIITKKSVRFLPLLFFFGMIGAIILLSLIVIGQASLNELSREGATVLSGREVIWFFTFAELQNISLKNLLFGYGAWSQAISGISDNYSFIFSNWANPKLASYHSAYLQVLLDIGLAGFLVYVLIINRYLRNLKIILNENFQDQYSRLHLAIIIYFVLFGLFDINLLFYNQMAFYIFSIHIMIVGLKHSKTLKVTVR